MRLSRFPRLASLAACCLALSAMLGSVPAPVSAASGSGARDAFPSAEQPRWVWPVDPPHAIVRPFQAPATPYSAGHRGVDLTATEGAAVYAPANGTVYFAGTVVDRGVVSVSHEGGYLSSFEPVKGEVVAGQPVAAGQRIGVVSGTSHCASPCLHFGLRKDGLYLSPMLFFDRIPPAVLLPLEPP